MRSELNARLAAGKINPIVLPHPDDFDFDDATGTVIVVSHNTMNDAMIEVIGLRDDLMQLASKSRTPSARTHLLAKPLS